MYVKHQILSLFKILDLSIMVLEHHSDDCVGVSLVDALRALLHRPRPCPGLAGSPHFLRLVNFL